jgi:hypothetical protein
MGCLDTDASFGELPVIAAERALPIPCLEHAKPPARISFAPGPREVRPGKKITGAEYLLGIQPDRLLPELTLCPAHDGRKALGGVGFRSLHEAQWTSGPEGRGRATWT